MYQSFNMLRVCGKVSGIVVNTHWPMFCMGLAGIMAIFTGLMWFAASSRWVWLWCGRGRGCGCWWVCGVGVGMAEVLSGLSSRHCSARPWQQWWCLISADLPISPSLANALLTPPGPCRSKRMLLASQLGLILTYAVAAGLIAAMYAKPISLDLKVGGHAGQCRCSVWGKERPPVRRRGAIGLRRTCDFDNCSHCCRPNAMLHVTLSPSPHSSKMSRATRWTTATLATGSATRCPASAGKSR